MRPRVKLYVEGGSSEIADVFRRGWVQFFKKAGLENRMPRVIIGKGRSVAFDLFKRAAENPEEGVLPLLLLDSEKPVSPRKSNWQHLGTRDGFGKPSGAGADDAFLMICCMETWFLADPRALEAFFKRDFRERNISKLTNLEDREATDVVDILKGATVACTRPYDKGRLSFELLATIEPAEVERRCPAAKSLLDRLRSLPA